MTKLFALGVAALLLAGCSITQEVKPVTALDGKEICVIENPAVRAGFIEAYKRSLSAKGFAVKQLPASATTTACPVTSTYNANWRWDLALYLAYAELRIYSNGKAAGEAKYDALSGSGNLSKFIEADKKIDELVNLLFPPGK